VPLCARSRGASTSRDLADRTGAPIHRSGPPRQPPPTPKCRTAQSASPGSLRAPRCRGACQAAPLPKPPLAILRGAVSFRALLHQRVRAAAMPLPAPRRSILPWALFPFKVLLGGTHPREWTALWQQAREPVAAGFDVDGREADASSARLARIAPPRWRSPFSDRVSSRNRPVEITGIRAGSLVRGNGRTVRTTIPPESSLSRKRVPRAGEGEPRGAPFGEPFGEPFSGDTSHAAQASRWA